MNIGFVVWKFPIYSNSFVLNEIVGLMKLGVNVTIYSFTKPNSRDSKLILYGDDVDLKDKIVYLCDQDISFLDWNIIANLNIPLCDNKITQEIRNKRIEESKYSLKKSTDGFINWVEDIKQRNINILHSPFSNCTCDIVLALHYHTKIPFTFECHAFDLFVDFMYEKEKIEKASGVFPISEYNKQMLISEFRCPTEKIFVKRVTHKNDFIPDKTINEDYILSACRLEEIKGLIFSITAFSKISKEFPNLKYYIAGDGSLKEDLLDAVEQLGMSDKIKFLGVISNEMVLTYIKSAKFTILTSVWDRCGNADGIPTFFIESMSLGIPCIGSNISGIPELIKSGKNGRLVDPTDQPQIIKSMKNILEWDLYYKKLSKGAVETIDNHFNYIDNLNIMKDAWCKII